MLPSSPSGHLAYVGTDGDVYVAEPLRGVTAQITDDRSSAGTGYGILHTGMAWSDTGELAFARTDVEAFSSTVYVTVPGSGRTRRVTRERGILIYASWSPSRCGEVTCSRLATITDVNREPGGNVALTVLAFPTSSSVRSVHEERAGELYFSWAGPDRMIRHIVRGRRGLDQLDVSSGAARPVAASLAPFLAPQYTEGRVVYAVADSPDAGSTVTATRTAVIVHVPKEARRVAFSPSPDGTQLAFAVRRGRTHTPSEAFEEPSIVDLRTAEMVTAGPLTLWTKAFYWSPDSKRLAYLTWLDNEVRQFNQWRLFDPATEKDRGFVSFTPTATFDTLTTFFDQFGQSHSLWSPDSRYLTYAAISSDGGEQVWLLDTHGKGKRIIVADGVVSVFSRG